VRHESAARLTNPAALLTWPLLVALAWLAGCAGSGVTASGDAGAEPEAEVVVRFDELSLTPAVARVAAGGNVVWLNEADHLAAVVVLPADIADSFTCDELLPRFSKVAAGYQSATIENAMENVGLPCPLKSGSYAYELRFFDLQFGSPDEPIHTLRGSIVAD
jgi:plastocyanin